MKNFRIGRDESNDFVINHPAVSGFHADINILDNGTIQYIDHSTNGTMINGYMVHNSTCVLYGHENITFPGNITVPVSEFVPQSMEYAKPAENYAQNFNQQQHQQQQNNNSYYGSTKPAMGFGETLGYFFKNYATFSGRARRTEYWFMYLWNIIFYIIPIINILWILATIIPSLALLVRRLHDTGRSGFWLFLWLLPLIGSLIIFIWTLFDSEKGCNKYGPSPKYN